MASNIGADVAKEHLTDGQDNIKECVSSIKRVLKSFPELEPELARATTHLASARESLEIAGQRLKK